MNITAENCEILNYLKWKVVDMQLTVAACDFIIITYFIIKHMMI